MLSRREEGCQTPQQQTIIWGQPLLDVVVIRGDQVLGKRNEKRNIGGKECNVIETLQRIPTESEVEEMGAAEATSAEGRTMMEG